ncbi:Hypothetical protein NCS54_01064800 [Fusarium falciforme]|uniref:Hypothetical protein n=1 Tax=Fusarium falciforme TaxID=195108 RepID=UPI0023006C8D|nr:Hypothetical protein NCS54_01064800 [Fusarium falciforme]WAO93114.1 Hypothetical protein NCS54_01064800 [Fusarium falciforme]
MQSRLIYGFITAASLFTGSIAGPCLPSVSSLSSTENVPSSTTDDASSSTSTVATLSSTEDATSTTGVTSSTEVASTTSQKSSASTTETITQLSSTSQATSTTSGVSSSASSVEPIPTFYIYVANTDADSIRGSNPLYRDDITDSEIRLNLYSITPGDDLYKFGEFHVQESTNRLMMGDFYASADSQTDVTLRARPLSDVTGDEQFVLCEPPLEFGQKLLCSVDSTPRTAWHVLTAQTYDTAIYLLDPDNVPDEYSSFEFIVDRV